MLSNSCIKLIQLKLSLLKGISINHIRIGELNLTFDDSIIKEATIVNELREIGFEPIIEIDQILTEKIKQAAVELIFTATTPIP